MAVSLFVNSTSALSSQTYASSVLQGTAGFNQKDLTRLGTSRLARESNGSIHLIEKTPAEVAGEKVFLPLSDKISTWISYVSSFAKSLPSFLSLPLAYAKEMRPSHGTMNFPSQKALASCLDKHPLTGKQTTPYLREKGITDAVAESFADTRMLPPGVDMGVMLALYHLNQKLELPPPALTTLQMNLVVGLKDCATGGEISEESSASYNHKTEL